MEHTDPFKVPSVGPPTPLSIRPKRVLPPCGWLLPLPEDADRREKPDKCGEPAPFLIRVKDPVSDVEVPVCDTHKAEHDEKAASFRQEQKEQKRARDLAS